MAEWYPNAHQNPGAAAGYRNGRSRMRACVLHYTVGVNSSGVGLRGYFHFLVSKDGSVEQYCELSAIAWHAGEWNGEGPGVEFERLGDWEPLTPEQLAAGGALIQWIIEQGIADNFYDGARLAVGSYSGFITHRSLQQSQPHSDYVTEEDWAAMRGLPVAPPSPSPAPAPSGGAVYTLGSGGPAVATIQDLMNQVGCGPIAVDGAYGPQTAGAVTCWQHKLRVDADGVWGPQTQAATDALFAYLMAAPPPAEPPAEPAFDAAIAASLYAATQTVVRRGDEGDAVGWVQALVNKHGFDAGAVDGDFGRRTDAAVREFQASRALDVDGIVGPATWRALTA